MRTGTERYRRDFSCLTVQRAFFLFKVCLGINWYFLVYPFLRNGSFYHLFMFFQIVIYFSLLTSFLRGKISGMILAKEGVSSF